MGQTNLDTGGQGLSSGSFTSLGGTLERLHSHLHVYAHIINDVVLIISFLKLLGYKRYNCHNLQCHVSNLTVDCNLFDCCLFCDTFSVVGFHLHIFLRRGISRVYQSKGDKEVRQCFVKKTNI